MTSLSQRTLSSLRWTAIAKIAGQVVSWAITIFVIRLLAPQDYGLLAMANVVVGLISMLAEMGFGASLVQSPEWDRRRAAQLFGAALVMNALVAAALVATAPLIAGFFEEPRVAAVIQVVAVQFILAATALVPDSALRHAMRFKELSILEIATGVAGHVVTLVLAYLGFGVWSLVAGGMAAQVLRTLLLYVVSRELVAPSFRLAGARSHFAFGASLTLTRFLWYVFNQCDTVIGGKLLGKEALGLYSVAVHLASLPMQRASSVINDVAFSAFAKIQHDRAAVAENVRLAIRLVSFFAFPALWGLASVAPELVPVIMGEKWLPAVAPLQIVALAVPLRMVGTIVSTTTMSVGRVDIALITILVGAVAAPPLFYLGSQFGIVGLAVVWAAITPAMFVINLYRATPNLGVAPTQAFLEMARPTLAALIMAAGVLALRESLDLMPVAGRLAIEIVAGVILYVAVTALCNRDGAREALRVVFPRRSEAARERQPR